MAISIPSQYELHTSTTVMDDYGTVIDYTDDGGTHARDLYSKPFYNINAVWDLLRKDEADSLRAFLLANRAGEISIDVDGVTYICKMVGFPKNTWSTGSIRKVVASFRGYVND